MDSLFRLGSGGTIPGRIRRAKRLQDLWQQYRQLMHTKSHSSAVLRLLDALFSSPIITITRAQELLGVTFSAAQQNIAKLENAGILRETTKRQRYRHYIAQGILDLLDEKDIPLNEAENATSA